jgi:hypothetical protein
MNLSNIPWPTCAVCNKTVESLESMTDFRTMKYVAMVKCHGEQEVASIAKEIIMDGAKIEAGIAFNKTTKLLTSSLTLKKTKSSDLIEN